LELRKKGLLEGIMRSKGAGEEGGEEEEEEFADEYMTELKDIALSNLMQMYQDGVKVKVIPVPPAVDGVIDIQKKVMMKMLRSNRGMTVANLNKSSSGIIVVGKRGGGEEEEEVEDMDVSGKGNIVNGKHLMHDIDMFSYDEILFMARKKTAGAEKAEKEKSEIEKRARERRGEEKKDAGEDAGVEPELQGYMRTFDDEVSVDSSISSADSMLVGDMSMRVSGRVGTGGVLGRREMVDKLDQTFQLWNPMGGKGGSGPNTTGGVGLRGKDRGEGDVSNDPLLRQMHNVSKTHAYKITKQVGIEKAYKTWKADKSMDMDR